jgi:hypothetical protein
LGRLGCHPIHSVGQCVHGLGQLIHHAHHCDRESRDRVAHDTLSLEILWCRTTGEGPIGFWFGILKGPRSRQRLDCPPLIIIGRLLQPHRAQEICHHRLHIGWMPLVGGRHVIRVLLEVGILCFSRSRGTPSQIIEEGGSLLELQHLGLLVPLLHSSIVLGRYEASRQNTF